MPIVKCIECNSKTYKRPSVISHNKIGVFCSKRCEVAFRTLGISMTCSGCGQTIKRKRTPTIISRSSSGLFFCSNKCRGSWSISKGRHWLSHGYWYNNKGKICRQIIEAKIGRKLKPNECVHHLNKNKQDDRLENLLLMTHSEHSKLHSREQISCRRVFSCIGCGKEKEYSPVVWNTFYNGDIEKMREVYRCKECYYKSKRWIKSFS